MNTENNLYGNGLDYLREHSFLFDDELGQPDVTSEEYREGVRDAKEGHCYNQYYLPQFDEHGNVSSVPKGGFNYDQGFKSVLRK